MPSPASDASHAVFLQSLTRVNDHITSRATALHVADPEELTTTSTAELVNRAFEGIPRDLPEEGLGLEAVTDLLLNTIAPAMAGGQAGPRWYGLVTGGVLPAAQLADQLVTSYDPNVQVHNLEDTLTSSLTPLTMRHLLSLLRLPPSLFTQNTLTTGATSSNILGLSLGRDAVISRLKASQGVTGWSVPEDGFGGVEVDVLCAVPHASIRKAAAIAGIGRRNVLELADADSAMPCDFRMGELEERLKANWGTGRGSIVVTSAGEVNTGGWTSNHTRIRELCDLYGAWLHIDAAFGAFATLLPEFAHLAGDLALGDSITSDAHKCLNVPYDCGLFFSRGPNGLYTLCGPGGNAPAYLTASAGEGNAEFAALEEYRNAPSPLFMGIENSSRFRALPLLSSLLSLGRQGYIDLFARNISFATHITTFLRSHASYDVLLPTTSEAPDYRQMNIVLFSPSSSAPSRFQGADGSKQLVKEINGGRKMFVTGTVWRGRGAIRLAVSNWRTEVPGGEREVDGYGGRDWEAVKGVLDGVMRE
ncbi:pyridoxal phosphate-dependent transferase [Leucosporidium creatinivorum]|uniref:Pyridoxal phosphate-dependent transferase n=1 Tax=Leucosporidium creatinivorum TaxID=106004 RepID=A0A1Y2E5M0_9BASI|nr:pyridoxal phosphate-dependent transferase [Leucosporidium creatinivorum]